MRTFKLFLVFLFLSHFSSAQDTETRDLSAFSSLSSSGSFKVYLEKGNEEQVRIVAKGIDLEDIETEVQGKQLKIKPRRKNSGWGGYRNMDVKIYVSYRTLESVELHGSGSILARSALESDELKLEIHGSGDIEAQVKADELDLEIHGSGDMNIRGKADMAHTQIHGSGDIEAYTLKVSTLKASIHGSGDLEIAVSDEIDAKIYGSGSLRYKGKPSREYVKTHGSGEARRID